VAATLLAYQPAWHAGFIWDDDRYITNNWLLTAPDGWHRMWFSLNVPSQYFPLAYTAFRLERDLLGLDPSGYHWMNLLLHAVNALLVWRLLWRLGVPGAWFAAALFALHPVQVETVAWLSEQKSLLSLLFCLLALLAWLVFIENRDQPRWRFYGLSLTCYALGLLSKSTACTLPVWLLLVLWLRQRPLGRKDLLRLAPFIMLGVAMGLVTMWWERYHQGTEGHWFAMGWLQRVLLASRAIWFYFGKLLWPSRLTFSYSRWSIRPADPLAYLWLLALGLAAGLVYLARRRLGRGPEVALTFFVVTLSPTLGFIMLYTFRFSFVADHYQYAACIGPLALVAAGLHELFRRWFRVDGFSLPNEPPETAGVPRRGQPTQPNKGVKESWRFVFFARGTVAAASLALLGGLTWHRGVAYQNLEALWQDTLAKNPESWLAHVNLGDIFWVKHDLPGADYHFSEAVRLNPQNGQALLNLGMCREQENRLQEATGLYERSIQAESTPLAQYGLASVLARLKQYEAAEPHFRAALQLKADFPEAWYSLGLMRTWQGRPDDAANCFAHALKYKTNYVAAHVNLGAVLLSQHKPLEALPHLQAAAQAMPNNPDARFNLAGALAASGDFAGAAREFAETCRLRPEDAEAHAELGAALAKTGRREEAIAHLTQALQLRPDYPQAQAELRALTGK
jgi:tetratricopeptide (TPR) repeat protein